MVAGLGDTGVLVATRLARSCDVVAVSTRPALVSGQELGTRLADPGAWSATYFVPFVRFRRLDGVRVVHGRIERADLDGRRVHVERADGTTETLPYDTLIVATGASNGFWRHDRVEDVAAVEVAVADAAGALRDASRIAVVGGGPTGVSVADNLARRGHAEVHLFWSGDLPLPEHHPSVRRWAAGVLERDGVTTHPGHRAEVPADATAGVGRGPITWTTGQEPFEADAVVWATGGVRPHSGFLPAGVLDDDGFVRVDEHLRVVDHPEVYAVGDVAASDPLRSSARNWGWRVVVANVRADHGRRPRTPKRYRAPEYRWGSVLGLQDDGLVVVQPDGKRVRIPRAIAASALYRAFIPTYLYGGLRPRTPRGTRTD